MGALFPGSREDRGWGRPTEHPAPSGGSGWEALLAHGEAG